MVTMGGKVGSIQGEMSRLKDEVSKKSTPFVPMSKRVCNNCGETGHEAKDCPNK